MQDGLSADSSNPSGGRASRRRGNGHRQARKGRPVAPRLGEMAKPRTAQPDEPQPDGPQAAVELVKG